MINLIRIATRKSPLAIAQAEKVKNLIEEKLKGTKVKLIMQSTTGDTISESKFKELGGKGLFLKELEELMINGKADIAVHSLKDVPAMMDKRFILSTIDVRENAADALISRKYKKIEDLPKGAVIGTSSPRRIAQIKNKYHTIRIQEIRGNVQTRIKKLDTNKIDAIILAAAGLERLSLKSLVSQYLPKEEFVPAAGQGVLCVQTIKKNQKILQKLKNFVINDVELCALEERSFVRKFNGDCFSPIAAHCFIKSNKAILTGYVSDITGECFIKSKIVESIDNIAGLGEKLAKTMIKQGAKKLIN